MELIGEDAATFVFMTPILWAFQWIRCSQTFLLKGFVKGLCTIQTKFRQPAWSLGVRAQVSPEDISLVELGEGERAASTSKGGAGTTSSRRAARESVSREGDSDSDERPSGKVRPSVKESSGAKAESEEEEPSGKVRASGKESTSDGKSTTNWNEARAAAGKRRAAAQIRNSSIGIGNLEPALGSRHLKPIRPKRPRIKRVIPIQSKTCHRAADVQDSPEYELSLCQPPIPTSPHQHGSLPTNVICSLPTNVMPDPASLSSAPGVQNSDTTYLSVQSLPPGHPLYFSRSGHPSPTMLESPNSQTGRQLSSSPMPQFSLNSMSPSYF